MFPPMEKKLLLMRDTPDACASPLASLCSATEMSLPVPQSSEREYFLPPSEEKMSIDSPEGVLQVDTIPMHCTSISSGWDFSALSMSTDVAKSAACEMLLIAYRTLNREQQLPVREKELVQAISCFIDRMEQSYFASTFHNFLHALDVAQLMFTLVTKYLADRVRSQDLFYLLVAAFCHDLCHRGLTTLFLRKHGLLEEETLEDFHCKRALAIIKEQPLFSQVFLRKGLHAGLTRFVTTLIDATDMDNYHLYLRRAREAAKGNKLRIEHLALIMKVSDLGNVARPFDQGYLWARKLSAEHAAGKQLPVRLLIDDSTPLSQRLFRIQKILPKLQTENLNTISCDTLARNTLAFLQSSIFPLLPVLASIDSNLCKDYITRINATHKCWQLFLLASSKEESGNQDIAAPQPST